MLIEGEIEACSSGKMRANAVHRIHNIRAGLAVNKNQHGRRAVRDAGVHHVLDGILYIGDIRKPHRRAILPGDDERPVFLSLEELVRRIDLPLFRAVLDLALWPIGIGIAQRRAHLLEADPITIELRRISVHAHGRPRAAADVDLAHALHLRDLLREDRIGRIIDIRREMLSEISARIMIEKSAGLIFR